MDNLRRQPIGAWWSAERRRAHRSTEKGKQGDIYGDNIIITLDVPTAVTSGIPSYLFYCDAFMYRKTSGKYSGGISVIKDYVQHEQIRISGK